MSPTSPESYLRCQTTVARTPSSVFARSDEVYAVRANAAPFREGTRLRAHETYRPGHQYVVRGLSTPIRRVRQRIAPGIVNLSPAAGPGTWVAADGYDAGLAYLERAHGETWRS